MIFGFFFLISEFFHANEKKLRSKQLAAHTDTLIKKPDKINDTKKIKTIQFWKFRNDNMKK